MIYRCIYVTCLVFLWFSVATAKENESNKDIQQIVNDVYLHADDNPVKTKILADQAFELLKQRPDDQLEMKLIYKLAWVYSRIGNIGKAESLAEQSLIMVDRNGGDEDRGDIYNLLGVIAWHQGDFSKAIDSFFTSLKFRNKVGDKENIAASLNNIGAAYQEIYEFENALVYHNKSLEIKRTINHTLGIATSLANIAVVYFELNDLEGAEKAALNALVLFEELNKSVSMAEVNIQLGEIYLKSMQIEQANISLNKAYLVTVETENKALEIRALLGLSKLSLANNDLLIAKQLATKALNNASTLKLQDKIKSAHLTLSSINEKQQDFESAFINYKSYAEIFLSLDKNILSQRIIALEKQLKNAEIEQALKSFEQQNKFKDILLKQQFREGQTVKLVLAVITILVLFILLLYYRLYKKNNLTYQMSIKDVLCDCFNRTYLFKEYAEKLYAQPMVCCVLLLDIDDFKKVNDEFGHEYGDIVLKEVAKCISSQLDEDILIRLGGEEFIVIGKNENNINLLAQKINASIASLVISPPNKPSFHVTCSAGTSTKLIVDKEDLISIISEADAAMYHAKEHGKNSVVDFAVIKPIVLRTSRKTR
ncbi:MAG: diguanylate cyclase (GGDEF)-like protein [Paraglaciecola sp.]|jgi:diguanylate cyclase (GGDEF)-like protein